MAHIASVTNSFTFFRVSISKVTFATYSFRLDRSMTRRNPPDFLGTRNTLEKKPCSSGSIALMQFFFNKSSIIVCRA